MKEAIAAKLREIEAMEGVRILMAVESGSRAWGFASPDSDYDVRFIYLRDTQSYLRLNPPRDVIEWQLDEVLDINGWDLRKALRLLYRSNPTLFEWMQSPIIYCETQEWVRVRAVADNYFLSRAGVYHYLSTAQSNYRAYLKGEAVRLKKYFYVLRPLLACEWIFERGTPPPMLFSDLMAALPHPEICPAVDALLAQKVQTPETGTAPRVDVLNAFIDEQLAVLLARAAALPEIDLPTWDVLDRLFYEMVTADSSQ